MQLVFLILTLSHSVFTQNYSNSNHITGAWKGADGVIIFIDGFFSYTEFQPKEFKFTYGGMWTQRDGSITLNYEYHTLDPDKVGSDEMNEFEIESNTLQIGELVFERIDDGSPGKLKGAWLFNNRMRDGELGEPRSADNPRKTMKIVSGTRFQWIAYNTETKSFYGTGGGTYTTENGKYTENIDFFSRDNNRVGASLAFDYELKGTEWHHSGLSSSGDPMYEIWKKRDRAE